MSLCLHVVLYLIVKNGIEMANHMRTILTDFLKKNFFKFSQLMQISKKEGSLWARAACKSKQMYKLYSTCS